MAGLQRKDWEKGCAEEIAESEEALGGWRARGRDGAEGLLQLLQMLR